MANVLFIINKKQLKCNQTQKNTYQSMLREELHMNEQTRIKQQQTFSIITWNGNFPPAFWQHSVKQKKKQSNKKNLTLSKCSSVSKLLFLLEFSRIYYSTRHSTCFLQAANMHYLSVLTDQQLCCWTFTTMYVCPSMCLLQWCKSFQQPYAPLWSVEQVSPQGEHEGQRC